MNKEKISWVLGDWINTRFRKVSYLLEYLLIANFSIFILFSIYSKVITKVCLLIGIILYIFLKIYERKKRKFNYIIPQSSLNKPIAVFLLASFISVIFSYDVYNSQQEFFSRIVPYFIFFYMGVFLSQKQKWIKFLIFLMLLGAAVLGTASIFKFIEAGKFVRVVSVLGAPVTTYFLCGLPFFACFVIFHPSKKIKIISALGGFLVLIGILFASFRGAWIALFLSFGGIFLLFKKSRKFSFWIVGLIVIIILSFPFLKSRIVSEKTLEPSSWGDRTYLWGSATNIFLDYPIFGIGLGGFEDHAYEYGVGKHKENKRHPYSHNVYLDILAEIGILGLASFLWIFAVFFKQIYGKLKDNFDLYKLAFMIAVSSFLIFNLTESIMLTGVGTTSFYWFIFGLGNGSLKNG